MLSTKNKNISTGDKTLIAELVESIRSYVLQYGTSKDSEMLNQAISDIRKHHEHQKRKSGQPFIIHPLRVAVLICRAGLDAPTVVAALLHDIIEDTKITHKDIHKRYGIWYADIVTGLTKIKTTENTKIGVEDDIDATYQRMLKAMVQDVRALFIKLFDRLDNMRDMESMPRHKQRRISLETLNVYVPIAERLGLIQISEEHTELCFKLLYPKRYQKTLTAIDDLKKARISTIQTMKAVLIQTLENNNLTTNKIEPLFVHPASQVKENSPIDHVLEGFRVTVKNSLDCFQALGILHTNFSVIPLKIRDYISNPLWNGYEGLQTELRIEGEQTCIEIVSVEMQEKNQFGIMAHWQGSPTELADYYRTYLSQLDQMAGEKDVRMLEVLSYVQSDQIQVYTPGGDMLVFPKGATVLDFAYGIHSDLGNHCLGALVNPSSVGATKKRVTRERQLFTGEALKIVTDPGIHPVESWFEQVKTAKSRTQIRRALEQQKVVSARNSGRAMLESKLRDNGIDLEVEKWLKVSTVKGALKTEHLSANKFLQEIGLQKRPLQKFLRKYKLLEFENVGRLQEMIGSEFWWKIFGNDKNTYFIEDVQDPLIRTAICCYPIPGDKITGFIHDDREIEIHQADCLKIHSKNKRFKHKKTVVDVDWKISKEVTRSYVIHLQVLDGKGILFQITKIIKDAGVAIINSETSATKNREANIRIKLEAISWPVFHKIIEKLRTLKFVKKIWE
ncbi:MAG: bifunctional (p)ppGpp synthetase/guanosine-3',5'-bis(diphosphate) 3'-pyrophosphohydrolase [SAR324 cluster bacterium]|nr:bifunctional (p)ppGpp synthetase/guanosine-3',5'-bis(diphosphate) 3'-pyrophosphohydrolase [SAR324 cluster bacterium]MBL7034903.1 bifunctional (p)ppGpp synthetase/guanosine-3',5'-bis(diphosphate) 3'-pyrophosphohydrolase [SAR324 cluster bacterium]